MTQRDLATSARGITATTGVGPVGAAGGMQNDHCQQVPDGTFAARLIEWQRSHGRNDLPWQGTRDAYRIWLSEIMLQQTQVATVIPYYQQFVARFPTVASLAAAELDEVLTLWSGLGYYSRARNLHRAACRVVEQHGGLFPTSFDDVLALPGIGRSTAGAVCAFAFGQRHPILDGNVKRVLARHAGVEGWAGDAAVQAALWRVADSRLPGGWGLPVLPHGAGSPGLPSGDALCEPGIPEVVPIAIYTQAIMDLGAGPCARARPRCAECPVQSDCVAHATDRVGVIPAPRPRRVMPRRSSTMWLLLDVTRGILLEQRPPSGIWGGLWSLPQQLDASIEAAVRAIDGAVETLAPIEHGFTHFRLTLKPLLVRMQFVDNAVIMPLIAAEAGGRWVPLDQIGTVALPAPVRTLLETLRASALDGLAPSGLPSSQRPCENDHA